MRTKEEHRLYMREWRKQHPAKSRAKEDVLVGSRGRPKLTTKQRSEIARRSALLRWREALPL